MGHLLISPHYEPGDLEDGAEYTIENVGMEFNGAGRLQVFLEFVGGVGTTPFTVERGALIARLVVAPVSTAKIETPSLRWTS
jgi:hypothetical protein